MQESRGTMRSKMTFHIVAACCLTKSLSNKITYRTKPLVLVISMCHKAIQARDKVKEKERKRRKKHLGFYKRIVPETGRPLAGLLALETLVFPTWSFMLNALCLLQ